MKKLVPLVLVLLASCSQPLHKMWSENGKLSTVPIAPGKLLWSSQETYALSGPDGKSLWSGSIPGIKRSAVYSMGGCHFVIGDERVLLRLDENGKIVWRMEASQNQGIYPVAVSERLLVVAFDPNASYPQNPVSLMALSLADGSQAWMLDDHDYSGALAVPLWKGVQSHIVIPQIAGDSVFLEGFDLSDGRFLWRKTWSLPPSGQHPIIETQKEFCWIWKKSSPGIEFGTIDKKTGFVRTVKNDDVSGLSDKIVVSGKLYLKLRTGSLIVGSDLKISKLEGIWFPIAEIPSTGKVAVIDRQCTAIAIADANMKNATKAFNIGVCYSGMPGCGFGEVYLYPVISPMDYPTFRCQLATEGMQSLKDAPEAARNLGKGGKLTDLVRILKGFRR